MMRLTALREWALSSASVRDSTKSLLRFGRFAWTNQLSMLIMSASKTYHAM